MDISQYREDEIQALIVLGELNDPIETPNNNFYDFNPKSIQEAQVYLRRFALDLAEAFDSLAQRGLTCKQDDTWRLTTSGRQAAREARRQRPPIWYWYKDFYAAVESSRAFSLYCERAYGRDLSQHGFSDMDELYWMLDLIRLDETTNVLDIGCGNGKIAEYISDRTSAHVLGIDYMPEAIAQARRRTAGKQDRLSFQVADIDELDLPGKQFDVILSIDSIFFGQNLTVTVARLKRLLKIDGKMAILCGEDLSTALEQNHLACQIYDRSKEHHQHRQRKRSIGAGLRQDFEAEGNRFIWENIMAESLDDTTAYDPANCATRYLYLVWAQPAS